MTPDPRLAVAVRAARNGFLSSKGSLTDALDEAVGRAIAALDAAPGGGITDEQVERACDAQHQKVRERLPGLFGRRDMGEDIKAIFRAEMRAALEAAAPLPPRRVSAEEVQRDKLLTALARAFSGRWEDRNVNFREGSAGLFVNPMTLTPLGQAALVAAGMAQKFEPEPGWLEAEGERAQAAFAKRGGTADGAIHPEPPSHTLPSGATADWTGAETGTAPQRLEYDVILEAATNAVDKALGGHDEFDREDHERIAVFVLDAVRATGRSVESQPPSATGQEVPVPPAATTGHSSLADKLDAAGLVIGSLVVKAATKLRDEATIMWEQADHGSIEERAWLALVEFADALAGRTEE
jgi:hypothetical protein